MIIILVIFIVFIFFYVNSSYSKNYYKDVQISIKGNTSYLVEKDIKNKIFNTGNKALMNISIRDISLKAIEKKIEQDPWVDNVHVYRDVQGILHVDIVQKTPVLRVFTIEGNSFYLDKQGNHIPLSLYNVANVPVCTAYPLYFNENNDKIFVADVLDLLTFTEQDDYLTNYISYINVMDSSSLEIIPKTGTPIVRVKRRDSKEQIVNKIKNFYLQVIPNVGWNYYTYIDLRFDNEIIALKKTSIK
ncbi:MAG: cell division protein FtsQ/DivIB [Chitinophagaceae bacterium]